MKLSIVIVNYNTFQLTSNCIESIISTVRGISYEIIVVDNASVDKSFVRLKDKFSSIKLIGNRINMGFAKANNQGIRESIGEYVLLLNSDTEVYVNSITKVLDFMDENLTAGASGCKVVMNNGLLDRACHRGFPTPLTSLFYFLKIGTIFPRSKFFNGYHLSYMNMNETHEIDCLVGAFMMVRRSTIQETGLLDETYFMYGEDIDWCYRIKKAGWKIYYIPEVEILHIKGGSSRIKPLKIEYEFHRAMWVFHRKHLYENYNLLINLFVITGICIRFIASVIRNYLKKIIMSSLRS